jgi:hypothetical protein
MSTFTDPKYLIAPIYHASIQILPPSSTRGLYTFEIKAEDPPKNEPLARYHKSLRDRWVDFWKYREVKKPNEPITYYSLFRSPPLATRIEQREAQKPVLAQAKTLQQEAKARGARIPSSKEALAMMDLVRLVWDASRMFTD